MIVERPPASVIEGYCRLLRVYSPSCVVADTLRREGVTFASIRPIEPDRAAWPAITVRLWAGEQADSRRLMPRRWHLVL